MTATQVIRAAVRAPVSGRTWREVGYALAGLLPALLTFALALVGIVACALSVIGVGLPLLAVVLRLARGSGAMFRRPARAILGWDWAPPPRLDARGIGWVRAVLRDPAAWRALVYGFVKLPLTLVTVYGAGVAVVTGTIGLTAPLWWFALRDGSWAGSLWLVLQAVAILLFFPWFVRFLVGIDRGLVNGLLAPTADSQRVAVLERSREVLTTDAASTLARIERDLHDGTQARFVTLGMTLSRLDQRIDDPEASQILATARHIVDDGLVELREIIAGLHPPALDDGLSVALATLASRCPVPTVFHDRLHAVPPLSTADALYFSTAELLTNVTRHAAASCADVTLDETATAFRLTVTDDGRGGAGSSGGGPSGTGLDGLRRRAEALDGTFVVDSPPGGPTSVVMTLPRVPSSQVSEE